MSDPVWHGLGTEAVADRLGVDAAAGLSQAEAAARLARVGPNQIGEATHRSPWSMFAGQFTDFMIVVLLIAAVVSGLIGELLDTVVIAIIVVLNGVLGFVQEYRAERAMAALKRLAGATARVLREGHALDLPAADLVPGDLVLLEAGNLVPADLRLVESMMLRVEEAALTGESIPVDKWIAAQAGEDLALGDRINMAYKGTIVAYGRGRGLVVATGMGTELGRIASLLSNAPVVQTPLQKRLADVGRKLALAALAICVLVFVLGMLRGESFALMFLTAVSLAVAAIPEALPAVVTISLALGAHAMVAHNALIRRLPAVEALGSVTVICSDKTGTLTQNRMRVERFWLPGSGAPVERVDGRHEPARRLLMALALVNDASLDQAGDGAGDPTEVALLRAAVDAGIDTGTISREMPRVAELPFDSDRKMMTTLHRDGDALAAFTKGAPESVIPRCEVIAGVAPDVTSALETAERLAGDGLRVIAVAWRRWPAQPAPMESGYLESGLTLLGLVAMIDPPRPEAGEAVRQCRDAGITPTMVTGDHPATAQAIARRLGILREGDRTLTGAELARLDDAAFARIVRDVRVYARVDPAQKIRIVAALQERGEFVAMTGDGVNDAPALRRAEIGVAMGRIGTDVTREASSMILLDDNFATIVAAVREGRRIYDNIRKFVRYVLAGNVGEITAILLAPLLGLPLPLLPIHILWINLVTDGLPGLALAVEPGEPDLMQRPPRRTDEGVFARGLGWQVLWTGLAIGVVTLGVQAWAIAADIAAWQTMTFTTLTTCQLLAALAIRSDRHSLLSIGLFGNRHLAAAVGVTLLLQLTVIYLPAMNTVFDTRPLSLRELAIATLSPMLVFAAMECEKWVIRRRARAAA